MARTGCVCVCVCVCVSHAVNHLVRAWLGSFYFWTNLFFQTFFLNFCIRIPCSSSLHIQQNVCFCCELQKFVHCFNKSLSFFWEKVWAGKILARLIIFSVSASYTVCVRNNLLEVLQTPLVTRHRAKTWYM